MTVSPGTHPERGCVLRGSVPLLGLRSPQSSLRSLRTLPGIGSEEKGMNKRVSLAPRGAGGPVPPTSGAQCRAAAACSCSPGAGSAGRATRRGRGHWLLEPPRCPRPGGAHAVTRDRRVGHRGSCPRQDGAEQTPLPLVHGVAVVSHGLKTLSPGQGQRPLPGNHAPRSARVTRSGPAASAPSRGGGPPSDTL